MFTIQRKIITNFVVLFVTKWSKKEYYCGNLLMNEAMHYHITTRESIYIAKAMISKYFVILYYYKKSLKIPKGVIRNRKSKKDRQHNDNIVMGQIVC
jgi:hypothetical protein